MEILFNDGTHPGYDPEEEAGLLYSFLQEPDLFFNRLLTTYSDFYEQAYKPGKGKLKKVEVEKLLWHQNKLNEGVESYLELLGLSSFLKSLSENEEPILYYSLFSDRETSSFWNKQIVVIGAGTDQKILNQSAKDKTDIFFSSFGDPKRLEILRLTAKRPWYSTELANHFKLKPATLSYHVNILLEAELLNIENGESRRFYYTLNRKRMKEYLSYVSLDLLGDP